MATVLLTDPPRIMPLAPSATQLRSTAGRFRFGWTLALLIVWSLPLAAQEATQPSVPSIVTTGEAIVRRAPDQAFLTAAVEVRAKSPRDAARQNADIMTAMRQRITSAGIPSEAMRTTGYDVQQEADFVNGRRVPRGYVVRNALEIRVDAIERTGEILDAAVEAGATSIAGVRFEVKDRDGAEREALRLAVADARARANAGAAGAGTTIDRVLRIQEMREVPPGPRPMMTFMKTADGQPQTPIEPGFIEIHARVVLTASFK